MKIPIAGPVYLIRYRDVRDRTEMEELAAPQLFKYRRSHVTTDLTSYPPRKQDVCAAAAAARVTTRETQPELV